MHGGAASSGAPTGNTNPLKHGRYTAEAIAPSSQGSEPPGNPVRFISSPS